jgi:hypothetical protein
MYYELREELKSFSIYHIKENRKVLWLNKDHCDKDYAYGVCRKMNQDKHQDIANKEIILQKLRLQASLDINKANKVFLESQKETLKWLKE